jgi:hypothetical protein
VALAVKVAMMHLLDWHQPTLDPSPELSRYHQVIESQSTQVAQEAAVLIVQRIQVPDQREAPLYMYMEEY